MLVTRYLLIKLEHHKQATIGPFVRYVGQKLIRAGFNVQGDLYQSDKSKLNLLLI